MNIFKKLLSFFKKKKESTEFIVEPPVVEESTMIEDKIEEDPIAEEDEDKMREKIAGEVEKEKNNKQEVSFSIKDKEEILEVIRPIIKSFNENEIYQFVCDKIGDGKKTLKTYSSLSEDSYELIISLTQSKKFNLSLNDFMNIHVITPIQYALNDRFKDYEYEFKSLVNNGSIIITKLQ